MKQLHDSVTSEVVSEEMLPGEVPGGLFCSIAFAL